jgi:coproporphyrinogen III oxidase-like Fe-S oxidoreductase
LPRQSLEEAGRDIATGIASGVGHISAYHLTLEPNTAFHHAPPPLPDDDLAADMQEQTEEGLVAAGFEHYETSAFARARTALPAQPELLDFWRLPGHRCRGPRQALEPRTHLA